MPESSFMYRASDALDSAEKPARFSNEQFANDILNDPSRFSDLPHVDESLFPQSRLSNRQGTEEGCVDPIRYSNHQHLDHSSTLMTRFSDPAYLVQSAIGNARHSNTRYIDGHLTPQTRFSNHRYVIHEAADQSSERIQSVPDDSNISYHDVYTPNIIASDRQCALCERPIEHMERSGVRMQFACRHLLHTACYDQCVRDGDAKAALCPGCGAQSIVFYGRHGIGNIAEATRLAPFIATSSYDESLSAENSPPTKNETGSAVKMTASDFLEHAYNSVPRVEDQKFKTPAEEVLAFTEICKVLRKACEGTLHVIPAAKQQFEWCREADEVRSTLRDTPLTEHHWAKLVQCCRQCLYTGEALQSRLTQLDQPQMHIPSSFDRNDPSFWILSNTFFQTYLTLVSEMRRVEGLRKILPNIIPMLRPVQKSVTEAARLIQNSPWNRLGDDPQPKVATFCA